MHDLYSLLSLEHQLESFRKKKKKKKRKKKKPTKGLSRLSMETFVLFFQSFMLCRLECQLFRYYTCWK